MAIRYLGYAVNYSEIHVGLIGDGVTTQVSLELTAAPFALSYPQKNWPTGCKIQPEDGVPPKSVTLTPSSQGCLLTMTFDQPPPAPQTGMLSPRTQMVVWLMHG